MIPHARYKLVVIAAFFWLTACDPTSPLFVRNGTSAPVIVQSEFEGEEKREVLLQPGVRVAFMYPAGDFISFSVLSNGEMIHDLDKLRIERLAQSVADLRQVTWNIEINQIRPISPKELEELNKAME